MNKIEDKIKIEKIFSDNLDVIKIITPEMTKYHLNLRLDKNDDFLLLVENLMQYIQNEKATIIYQFVFGSCKYYHHVTNMINGIFGRINWPVTWLQGDSCSCDSLTGIQVMAVSGIDVIPLTLNGQCLGSTFEDQDNQYCYLGNIHTDDISAKNAEQAKDAYIKMLNALKTADMDFSNVIRMWNYLENLLEWYDDFNDMRTEFFNKHNVFDNIIPAGTGIGAGNPEKTAYTGDLLAVKPKHQQNVSALDSPLQCPAVKYKSSFSRAIEMDLSAYRYLSVSGTASIEPEGKTVHQGDVAGQIELTMKVVNALLNSREMEWNDTVRAIAYFSDINDVPLFYEFLRKNNLPKMPVAISHAMICRDDLLFEIELEAVKIK